MHLQNEQIQRLLHGELDADALADARAHGDECHQCRSRIEAAAREEERIHELLGQLDHAPPAIPAETVIGGARRPRVDLRWVAGIVLALGAAGAAYAVPGSPLPGWVDAVIERLDPSARGSRAADPTTPADPGPSGIAVRPGERLTLMFEIAAAGGVATVALTDEATLQVRAVDGAAAFTSGADRLTVAADGATRFEIEVPRGAPWVEIRTEGQRVWLKIGAEVVTDGALAEGGSYVLPLSSRNGNQ